MQASGSRFGLTLDVNPDNPPEYSTLLGQLLKSQLAQVGIQITLNVFPDGATAFTTVSNYNYDIFINDVFNWGDPTIGVARTYACDNIRKGVMFADMSQYCNPQLDAIEASAASATDANQAQSDWNQYQHLLTQDVPIRWLSTESFHVVASAGLANLPTGAWGDMAPMYNLATTR
jgi:peptide/nickel transport system substrate-binding protein